MFLTALNVGAGMAIMAFLLAARDLEGDMRRTCAAGAVAMVLFVIMMNIEQ